MKFYTSLTLCFVVVVVLSQCEAKEAIKKVKPQLAPKPTPKQEDKPNPAENQKKLDANADKKLEEDEKDPRNKTLSERVLDFKENLIEGNLTEVLKDFKDNEGYKLVMKFLPSSKDAVARQLEEEANRAFVASVNARYSHCFNVSTTMPDLLVLEATKCAAKNLHAGLVHFNSTVKGLLNIPHFLNDTIDKLKECKKINADNLQDGATNLLRAIRRRRSPNRAAIAYRTGVEYMKNGAKALGRSLLRYSRIVGKYTGHKLHVVRTYIQEKYKKMYSRVRTSARPVIEKFKKFGAKTVKVAKLTTAFVAKYYCYYDTAQRLVANVTSLIDDFIDRNGVLQNTKDAVKLCVSKAIDAKSTELCTGRHQVPELSDLDETEEFNQMSAIEFDFDNNHSEL